MHDVVVSRDLDCYLASDLGWSLLSDPDSLVLLSWHRYQSGSFLKGWCSNRGAPFVCSVEVVILMLMTGYHFLATALAKIMPDLEMSVSAAFWWYLLIVSCLSLVTTSFQFHHRKM